jgi:capsular polysaccharide biosynthesis protein
MFTLQDDAVFCRSITEVMPAFVRKASAFSSAWSGVGGGTFQPSWWTGDIDIPGNAFTLYEAENVLYAPQLGIIAKDDGRVSRHSMRQAGYADPELKGLAALWPTRSRAPLLDKASIVLPWGAFRNYGHFLLDGLTSAPFLARPFVTPPLQGWQRDHFKTLRIAPDELVQPLYRIRKAAYTSGFGQNLHNPNMHFVRLRELQRTSPLRLGRKLYISRKGLKRTFKSEDALIGELQRRDFTTIQPETLPVVDQISAFREADVIVAPKGSAMANCLYCKPGATVVEIISRDMTRSDSTHKWSGYLLAFAGADWRPYFCENDQSDDEMPVIGGVKRPSFLSFDADLDDLLGFIDQV